jgi:hypothetical protein
LKATAAVLLAILAGCTAAPPETPSATAPPPCCPCACPPPAAAAAPTPAATPSAATAAARAYHATEKSIAPAVTSPAASAAYIRAVDQADKLAREAVRLLVSQDGHPTPDAIAGARRTMDDLIRTLDTPQ